MRLFETIAFPPAGRYVLAVSGGVDSMTLLDVLAKRTDLDLIVAHFDHGWREDSARDGELIEAYAKVLGLPLYIGSAKLDNHSEAEARLRRYDFLHSLAAQQNAAGIVTAHHANDKIETSWLNVVRGTSRRGRAPELQRLGFWRPLQNISKAELVEYAQQQGLPWREDSTNADIEIPRNFVRRELNPGELAEYDRLMAESLNLSWQIERELESLFSKLGSEIPGGFELKRSGLQSLPADVVSELLTLVVRRLEPGLQLSKKQIIELAHTAKTGRAGIKRDVAGRLSLEVTRDTVAVVLPRNEGAATLD